MTVAYKESMGSRVGPCNFKLKTQLLNKMSVLCQNRPEKKILKISIFPTFFERLGAKKNELQLKTKKNLMIL